MAVNVKKITLWRGRIANRPGSLAEVLAPLAAAKSDLQVVMGYHEIGAPGEAVVELYPVSGSKASGAAARAGLGASGIPTLLVTGDNRAGLGHAMAAAIAEAGINLSFLVAQVAGRKYSAVLGFEREADASRAQGLIKKAARKRS
jgi:hypothetical protein